MKILALCTIKTQLWCFLKTKNCQKFLTWIWLNISKMIMSKTWEKAQKRLKKDPHMKLPVHFTVLHIQKFADILSNLAKIALFKNIFAPCSLEMTKYTEFMLKNPKNSYYNLWGLHFWKITFFFEFLWIIAILQKILWKGNYSLKTVIFSKMWEFKI